MKTIDIGSVAGIDEALRFLETEMSKEAMQAKADKIATALIEKAKGVAESIYPPEVSVEIGEGGKSLIASGPEVVFIEFGAGLTTDGSGEFAAHAPFNVEEGSYSVSQNPIGEYARTGFQYWHHDGKTLNALAPHPGMETARQYVTDEGNIENVAREVIHLD